ncbi:hypothetical protein JL721_10990 [Aureococcus anophagefferens]|nr:hypothetical protein JL721_10990 [Aureococcus anophagefferens]
MPCAVDWESEKRRRSAALIAPGVAPFGDGKKYTVKEYPGHGRRLFAKWLAAKHAPKRRSEGRYAAAFCQRRLRWAPREDYWDAVDRGAEAVEVEYGNDVDVHEFWSGFRNPTATGRT